MGHLRASIARRLRDKIRGEVIDDVDRLRTYSTDRGIYRVEPLVVCFPDNTEELLSVMTIARSEAIPVTARGKGSGTAGACLGKGIVVGFSARSAFSRIGDLEGMQTRPQVTAGAGVLHKHLQDFLYGNGLFLPADPSSSAISCIGGNLGTKASGPHELSHGSIDRYVMDVQFVTARGEFVDTRRGETIPVRIAEALNALGAAIRLDHESTARIARKRAVKCASGYQLGALAAGEPICASVRDLLVGSIGTLGVITSATLTAVPRPRTTAAGMLFFDDLSTACRSVACLRESGAAAIEIINAATLRIITRRQPAFRVPHPDAHLLFIEYEGAQCDECVRTLPELLTKNGLRPLGPPVPAETSTIDTGLLWKMRKEILPMVMGHSQELIAPSLVNDIGVPVDRLAEFIGEAEAIFAGLGLEAAVYGHAGSGNLHLRPLFQRSRPDLAFLVRETADRIYETAVRLGGTITAEHGMGRLRAPYLELEWGDVLVGYMQEIKRIFDPDDLLNPGILFSGRDLLDEADESIRGPNTGKEQTT